MLAGEDSFHWGGGGDILINSSLSSIPLYMMSFYELPVGVRKRLDFFRARMLWQEGEGIKKYHLVAWDKVCQLKELGSMGILNLDVMNKALLGKWIWKLFDSSGLWQKLLHNRYIKGKCLGGIKHRAGDSMFWSGILI